MAWKALEARYNKVMAEIKQDEFSGVERLKDEFMQYFAKNKYSDEELKKAKEYIRILNQDVHGKIDFYSEQIDNRRKDIANINVYSRNINLMDFE